MMRSNNACHMPVPPRLKFSFLHHKPQSNLEVKTLNRILEGRQLLCYNAFSVCLLHFHPGKAESQ